MALYDGREFVTEVERETEKMQDMSNTEEPGFKSFQLEAFKKALDAVPSEDRHEALTCLLGRTSTDELAVAIGEVYDEAELFDLAVALGHEDATPVEVDEDDLEDES